jgi:hypothetical protein
MGEPAKQRHYRNITVYVGDRFGHLTVIERGEGGRSRWICRCDCGSVREYTQSGLVVRQCCGMKCPLYFTVILEKKRGNKTPALVVQVPAYTEPAQPGEACTLCLGIADVTVIGPQGRRTLVCDRCRHPILPVSKPLNGRSGPISADDYRRIPSAVEFVLPGFAGHDERIPDPRGIVR